jgi:hypothetical protein
LMVQSKRQGAHRIMSRAGSQDAKLGPFAGGPEICC